MARSMASVVIGCIADGPGLRATCLVPLTETADDLQQAVTVFDQLHRASGMHGDVQFHVGTTLPCSALLGYQLGLI